METDVVGLLKTSGDIATIILIAFLWKIDRRVTIIETILKTLPKRRSDFIDPTNETD